MRLPHSLTMAFNRLNGHILALAAKTDIVPLAEYAFGRTNIFANSRALRIAAENHSYGVLSHMLNVSAQGVLPSQISFRLGENWDRVQELRHTDQNIGAALQKYEADSQAALDKIFRPSTLSLE